MKPIEAGCIAIIIADEDVRNIGKEVTVQSFANFASRKKGANMWKVISTRTLYVYNERLNKTREINKGICFESNLMRIDGGDPKDLINKRINFLEVTGGKVLLDILREDHRELDWAKLHNHPVEDGNTPESSVDSLESDN